MQINFSIKVEKRHLAFLVVLICVLFVVGVSAYVNPTTHVGHDANETGPGTFGGDANSLYSFPGNVNVSGNITLGGISRGSWPFSECQRFLSDSVESSTTARDPDTGRPTVTVSCPPNYPYALTGGCLSRCVWLERDEIIGNTQYCSVVPQSDISPWWHCIYPNQGLFQARITCCK